MYIILGYAVGLVCHVFMFRQWPLSEDLGQGYAVKKYKIMLFLAVFLAVV